MLSLSRSYLAHLMPIVARNHPDARYHHIVQTDAEERLVRSLGGEVAVNLQRVVREGLCARPGIDWLEPADFRDVTGFDWCPILADRNLPNFQPAIRLRIAGAIQTAFNRLFQSCRFDAFVSEPVVLFPTHLLLYLCRLHSVRTLLWSNTYFPGHFYFSEGCDNMHPIRNAPTEHDHADTILSCVRAYVDGVREDRAGPVYHPSFSGRKGKGVDYLAQRRGRAPLVLRGGPLSICMQGGRLARSIAKRVSFPWGSDYMSAGAVPEHLHYLRCLISPRSGYDRMPDESSRGVIVYPLQFEPEGSLLYFAPEIEDQHSFVESILRALPAGCTLWVKEHPNQFGALGLAQWRALRRTYGNLRFIHGRESGRELIRRSVALVTISSSMGMDGLLLGRPVLVAGKVFYRNFDGAIPVDSVARLASALQRLPPIREGGGPDRNLEELVAFGMKCWCGDPQPSETLFSQTNIQALVRAIDRELRSSPRRAAAIPIVPVDQQPQVENRHVG